MMGVNVGLLDHYNLCTRNLDETVQFYQDVLGLERGWRPPLDIPGAWLYSEGRPIVHVNDIAATDQPQKMNTGSIDHVAFASRGFKGMKLHLASKGIEFRSNELAGGRVWQIFLRDPNGVVLELNFDVAKEQAEPG
jgi:catechol 2,3-dioxygenase-like lactoylglutathione lyase family enzyme